jgi:hypothetical protein
MVEDNYVDYNGDPFFGKVDGVRLNNQIGGKFQALPGTFRLFPCQFFSWNQQ